MMECNDVRAQQCPVGPVGPVVSLFLVLLMLVLALVLNLES